MAPGIALLRLVVPPRRFGAAIGWNVEPRLNIFK